MPSAFSRGDQPGQPLADVLCRLGEVRVALEPIEAARMLALEQLAHRRLHGLGLADIEPQRAAVDREPADVVQHQTMAPEQPVERGDREIAQMLVVDRVELAVIDQVDQIGHFKDRDAVGGKQRRDPLD